MWGAQTLKHFPYELPSTSLNFDTLLKYIPPHLHHNMLVAYILKTFLAVANQRDPLRFALNLLHGCILPLVLAFCWAKHCFMTRDFRALHFPISNGWGRYWDEMFFAFDIYGFCWCTINISLIFIWDHLRTMMYNAMLAQDTTNVLPEMRKRFIYYNSLEQQHHHQQQQLDYPHHKPVESSTDLTPTHEQSTTSPHGTSEGRLHYEEFYYDALRLGNDFGFATNSSTIDRGEYDAGVDLMSGIECNEAQQQKLGFDDIVAEFAPLRSGSGETDFNPFLTDSEASGNVLQGHTLSNNHRIAFPVEKASDYDIYNKKDDVSDDEGHGVPQYCQSAQQLPTIFEQIESALSSLLAALIGTSDYTLPLEQDGDSDAQQEENDTHHTNNNDDNNNNNNSQNNNNNNNNNNNSNNNNNDNNNNNNNNKNNTIPNPHLTESWVPVQKPVAQLYAHLPAWACESNLPHGGSCLYIIIFASLAWFALNIAWSFSHEFTGFLDHVAFFHYTALHVLVPVFVAGYLWVFQPPGALLCFALAYGVQLFLLRLTHLVFPTTPPWFHLLHPNEEPTYWHRGYTAGLYRILESWGVAQASSGFRGTQMVFGTAPSLHGANATLSAIFLLYYARWPVLRWFGVLYSVVQWWSTMYLVHHWRIDLIIGLWYSLCATLLLTPLMLRTEATYKHVRYVQCDATSTQFRTLGMRVFAGTRFEWFFDPYYCEDSPALGDYWDGEEYEGDDVYGAELSRHSSRAESILSRTAYHARRPLGGERSTARSISDDGLERAYRYDTYLPDVV